jgi:hypothetical protein
MNYTINDTSLLRKILWVDTILGGTTAIVGLLFFRPLTHILGLPVTFILSVSVITLGYSLIAGVLANQINISVSLLRTLIYANWVWTFISIGLLLMHFNNAQLLGKIFLILQIIVVGGLAYLEGKQLVRHSQVS